MFGFDQIPEFSTRDPEGFLRGQREQMGQLQELHDKIGNLTGRAESDDHRVSVAYSESRGVHDLRLDPRALRMPSEDLAGLIERLVNDARADLRRQTAAAAQEAFGDAMSPPALLADLPKMEASLGEIMKAAKESSNDIAAMAQRLMSAMPKPPERGADGSR